MSLADCLGLVGAVDWLLVAAALVAGVLAGWATRRRPTKPPGAS